MQSSPDNLELTLRIFLKSQTNIMKEEVKIICDILWIVLKQMCRKMPDLTSTIEDFESQIDMFKTYPELYWEKEKNKVSSKAFNESELRPFWLYLLLKLNKNEKHKNLVNKRFNTVLKMAWVRFIGWLLGDIEKANYFMLAYHAAVTNEIDPDEINADLNANKKGDEISFKNYLTRFPTILKETENNEEDDEKTKELKINAINMAYSIIKDGEYKCRINILSPDFRSTHAIISISGFTSENEDMEAHWKSVPYSTLSSPLNDRHFFKLAGGLDKGDFYFIQIYIKNSNK